jgi:probable addiction module antidote protein
VKWPSGHGAIWGGEFFVRLLYLRKASIKLVFLYKKGYILFVALIVNQQNRENLMAKDRKNFVESLIDLEESCAYLNVALQFNPEADFLFALRNVVIAQGGFAVLAEKTGLGRESLYKSLTPHSDPRFGTVLAAARALGFELQLTRLQDGLKNKNSSKIRQRSLADLFPEICQEWDVQRNDQLTPNDVIPTSKKKVWWTCKNEHAWQASCNNRIVGSRCPYCAGSMQKHG